MPNISPSTAAVAELNQRYGTQLSGKDEVIKWPYYDSAAYPMAGSTRLQYFQAVTTNLDNSNVEQAAAFPAPKKFFLRGLGTFLVGAAFPSTTEAVAGTGLSARVNDNHEVMTSGRLALLIGNKQYLFAAPLGIIPSPVMFNGYAAIALAQAAAADATTIIANQTNGADRGSFVLDPPLLIDSQINFIITTEWTTAVAISAATRLFVYMLGQMIRPAQ